MRILTHIINNDKTPATPAGRRFGTCIHTGAAMAIGIAMAITAMGCDEQSSTSVNPVFRKAALLVPDNEAPVAPGDDEMSRDSNIPSAETILQDPVVFGGDEPEPVIDVTWLEREAAGKGVVTTSSLAMVVTNHLAFPAEVAVRVYFSGILEETAEVEMGPFTVAAEDEMVLQIENGDVPMQTTRGVCQAVASVTAEYGDGERHWRQRASTDGLFYRNLPGYSGMMVFDEKIFVERFQGRFSDVSDVITAGGIGAASEVVLGRIKRNSGAFEDVRIAADALSASLVVGTSMGYGDGPETEVSHVE